ncbi:transcription factor MADS-box, partial [Microbacterium laevaniformans OR221]
YRTFLKRKGGLFKKAHELSVLCSVDVAVIVFGNNKKLYEYSSSDIGEILQRHNFVSGTVPWESDRQLTESSMEERTSI